MSFSQRALAGAKQFCRDFYLEIFAVAFYFFLIFLIPSPTFDWGSYVVWADYIRSAGLDKIYLLSYVNYMPLNIFALQLWQLGAAAAGLPLDLTVHWVKIYPLLFDCLSILLVLQIARRFNYSRILALFCLLPNIAFHYNSLIWGQFDSVYTFFVLAAVYACSQRKFGLAALLFLLALNGKLQAVIFLPVVVLFACLTAVGQRSERSWPRVALAVFFTPLLLIAAQWLLFSPFSEPSPLEILSLIWSRSVALSSYVTFNADNFWILTGAVTMQTLDTQAWLLGVPYKTWGYGLFFATSGVALLPLAIELVLRLKSRLNNQAITSETTQKALFELTLIALYLVSVNFFFFLTQMHERYVHPAILFASLIAIAFRRPWILIMTSIAYIINLERVNHFWLLTPLLEEKLNLAQLSAVLFAWALFLGYILLFQTYWQIHQRKTTIKKD